MTRVSFYTEKRMTTKLLIISYIPYWNAEQKVLKKLAELVRVTIHNRKPTPIIIQNRTRQKHWLAAYAPYASAVYRQFPRERLSSSSDALR